MAFSSINNTEIEVGDFGTQSLFQKIKDNDDYLYGQIGGLDSDQAVYNGSLEIDVDSDDVPDGWTVNLFSGGSKDLVGTASGHGQKQLEFTHPGGAGNGAGSWSRLTLP